MTAEAATIERAPRMAWLVWGLGALWLAIFGRRPTAGVEAS